MQFVLIHISGIASPAVYAGDVHKYGDSTIVQEDVHKYGNSTIVHTIWGHAQTNRIYVSTQKQKVVTKQKQKGLF